MKTISLLATVLVLPAASLLAQGQSDIDLLKARIDVQERRISQLENALIRLSSQSAQQAAAATPQKASSPAASQPGPVANQSQTYQVAQGDTLTRIAKRHKTTVAAIKKENGLKSDALRIGQKLRIPIEGAASALLPKEAKKEVAKLESKPTPTKSPAKSAAKLPAVAGKYTVKSGDTFYGIARQYQMSEATLQAANPKAEPTRLQIGQVLVIDASAKPAAKPAAKSVTQSTSVAKKSPSKSSSTKSSVAKTSQTSKSTASAPKSSSSVPKKSSTGIRTITVQQQMTYGEFANQYGASTGQLNSLNGLNLSKSTMLAKGSELYVPQF